MEPEALSHLQVGERRDIEDMLPVTFRPPLYEQRRGWVLEILRKEQVRSVSIIPRCLWLLASSVNHLTAR